MKIYAHFPFTGQAQTWTVPANVINGKAYFEVWGAAGGMSPAGASASTKKYVVRGSTGSPNVYFNNAPTTQGQLGYSYANNGGYAAGWLSVTNGDLFYVNVGGNGGPSVGTILLNVNGVYHINTSGGAGGWNGGGAGGNGAEVTQNLYNSTSTAIQFTRSSIPPKANSGNLWYDTAAHLIRRCTSTYSSGASLSKWATVTWVYGVPGVGAGGGGGGGATDIRHGGDDLGHRILVAGGSGGSGGVAAASGVQAWALRTVPATPQPPFGADTVGTGASGVDHTWATSINYLVGGYGSGGIGGGSSPNPTLTPTPGGGSVTPGGSGGPATGRAATGVASPAVANSGGQGGGATAGGQVGAGGTGGSSGSLGQGGRGANATGGWDAWCAGGAGGGGGYYGGGGGGHGFRYGDAATKSGGGGGGSNYADPSFTGVQLYGCARPPQALSNYSTGANGYGGFARISYDLPPLVQWKAPVSAALTGQNFPLTFDFSPAQANGAAIDHFIVGTATTPTATTPTTQTTVMVSDSTQTEFTYSFAAPPSGSSYSYFVQVVDKDGDASTGWLKQIVTGVAAGVATPATITAPASGSQFIGSATVTWTPGTQSPVCAYRLALSGTPLTGGATVTPEQTGWRRGGSRVNFALDPGFTGAAVWASTHNVAVATDTSHPGVSGSDGKIAWTMEYDGGAEQHSTVLNSLVSGRTYRLHLGVASALANDIRPVTVQVWDADGLLTSKAYDLSANAAGVYTYNDIAFTPHTQGVYFVVLPSSVSVGDNPALWSVDFNDGTTGGFTGTVANDSTHAYAGSSSLKATGAGSADLTAALTAAGLGAGTYVFQCWAYTPSAVTGATTATISGTGIASTAASSSPTKNAFTEIRVPFVWDGVNTVTLGITGDATNGIWWDSFDVWQASGGFDFGNVDQGVTHFLADMLVEMVYEEDAASGYQTYFDGSHANSNPGTASWSGATNASASELVNTDVTTSSIAYSGAALLNGQIALTTLSETAAVNAFSGATATVSVLVNPSIPQLPTVGLTVDNNQQQMILSINANDSAASVKTTSFDVYRSLNGGPSIRIATGLIPDGTTRNASYYDAPGLNGAAVYTVRAFDQAGGYIDQPNGSVTVLG